MPARLVKQGLRPFRRRTVAVLAAGLLVVTLLSAGSCDTPECPKNVSAPGASGMSVPQPFAKADAVLEISHRYLLEKVRTLVATSVPRPTAPPPTGPATGARVDRIYLDHTGPNEGVLRIELQGILYSGPNLEREEALPGFTLRLKMTPSLSDGQYLLNLAFVDLTAGSPIAYADNELIACGSGFNKLTEPILTAMLPALPNIKPIPIPITVFNKVLGALTEDDPPPVEKVGLVVRPEGLRLGVAIASSAGDPFYYAATDLHITSSERDSQNIDWGLELAYDQLRAKVIAIAGQKVDELKRSEVRFDPDVTTVEPRGDHYRINPYVRLSFCGGFAVTIHADFPISVGDAGPDPNGNPIPVLQGTYRYAGWDLSATTAQLGCIGGLAMMVLLKEAFSTFGTGTIGPGPPTTCTDVLAGLKDPLKHELDGDVLYVTEAYAGLALSIGGRSRMVDNAKPGRPVVPPCQR